MFINSIPLLQDYLIDSSQKYPQKIALICDNNKYTYNELNNKSDALAKCLIKNGIIRGDRVIIYADNTIETVISFWAVLKANAVVSIVNPQTKGDKLAWLINDCRATVLITDYHIKEQINLALQSEKYLKFIISSGKNDLPFYNTKLTEISFNEAINTDEAIILRTNIDIDLAAIIYTSGSTGDPKGVMLSHRNMLTAATSISTYLENTFEDIILNVLPLAFDYGLYQMIMAFKVGATLVLERSFAFPGVILQKIIEEKVTGFAGVPTIFSVMAGMRNLSKFDLSSIKYVTNTAAALSVKHIEFITKTFPTARVYSMYGLTECKRCTYLPPKDIGRKPLSVGIAIPNTELWLVDENDHKLGANEIGQLVIRGATVMKGYWEKPFETAEKLKPGPLPGEQVLYTGDLCKLDEEGYLYFIGRMDDIIKTRGEKVSPREVENIIYSYKGVQDVAVIGVNDEMLGQAVKAFVVPEPDVILTSQEILAYCSQKLENFMMPKYIEIISYLPKTSTGKIKKKDLNTDAK